MFCTTVLFFSQLHNSDGQVVTC